MPASVTDPPVLPGDLAVRIFKNHKNAPFSGPYAYKSGVFRRFPANQGRVLLW